MLLLIPIGFNDDYDNLYYTNTILSIMSDCFYTIKRIKFTTRQILNKLLL